MRAQARALLDGERVDLAQDGDLGVEALGVGEQDVVERHHVGRRSVIPGPIAALAMDARGCPNLSTYTAFAARPRDGASRRMTSRIGALDRWMLASTSRSFMCR